MWSSFSKGTDCWEIDSSVDEDTFRTLKRSDRIAKPKDALFRIFERRLAGPAVLDLEAIAEVYWQLHTQHRSAWTHELDLRPYKESF